MSKTPFDCNGEFDFKTDEFHIVTGFSGGKILTKPAKWMIARDGHELVALLESTDDGPAILKTPDGFYLHPGNPTTWSERELVAYLINPALQENDD